MQPWLRRGAWGLWAGVVLGLAGGCGGGGDSVPTAKPGPAKPKLLFITNGNSAWWSAVEKGMKDGGDEFGCDPVMRRNNSGAQGQIEKLREALSLSDVSGVAISAIEADIPGLIDGMKALQKAGKFVITIDSDVADPTARSAYIGTNNLKAGEAAGRAAAILRPEGGKVVLFVGNSSAANARDREKGFFLGAGPKFIKADTWQDSNDMAKATSNVKSAITKTPDLGVLVGLWSYNAPAIATQVRHAPEVRKKANVVTFDLEQPAIADLSDGFIDATVCQNTYEIGRQGVKLLKALIAKDEAAVKEIVPDGKGRDTGVRVIVSKPDSPLLKSGKEKGDDVITIEEMKSWLESKGLKSS